MWEVTRFLLWGFVVVTAQHEVILKADMHFLRAPLSGAAYLECCCTADSGEPKFSWMIRVQTNNITEAPQPVNSSDRVITGRKVESDTFCGTLTFKSVQLNDSGLYQCFVNSGHHRALSHGTYLQVYKPLEKTLNLSENTKNKILTAEGILIFLCVLLPATVLLFQSKKVGQLERKRVKKEEENIYQGLNLDDCCTTYDQIERSQAHGPYQDVCHIVKEEEDIQLEKP